VWLCFRQFLHSTVNSIRYKRSTATLNVNMWLRRACWGGNHGGSHCGLTLDHRIILVARE